MKPVKGDIRSDGKRYDGFTWRKTGVNHHMNDEGLVYYKRKYRTLEGYLQQGGSLERVAFRNSKINASTSLPKSCTTKRGQVMCTPSGILTFTSG